ncbi:rhomboid family intramembrane serine protease [Mammaliicoccus vitulinus]|uniref:rhomboid family intramembrane serine protease n=1 Tax=Mammaliicoccus vitulinus TaxID=71237 RepID=UPI00248C4716|nr:rhomboid family intramembrane serine protease [Mammaliicoccus vitulinus]
MFVFDFSFKNFLRDYKVTALLIFLVLFNGVITLIFYGTYNDESIEKMGALVDSNIRELELWRLFTYSFGHMSVLHLIINPPMIYFFGRPLEKYFGSLKFLAFTIFISLITGILITIFHNGIYPLSGSSSFGSGYLGIYFFFILFYSDKFYKQDYTFLLMIIGSFVISTFVIPDISIVGHIGGFLVGFIVAVIFNAFHKKIFQVYWRI